ncbi:hypothetical protein Esti_006812 [Eimeria stiedai]
MTRPGLQVLGAACSCCCCRGPFCAAPAAVSSRHRPTSERRAAGCKSSLFLGAPQEGPQPRFASPATHGRHSLAWFPEGPPQGTPLQWQRQQRASKVDVSQLPPWRRWQQKRRPKVLQGPLRASGPSESRVLDVHTLLGAATASFLGKVEPLLQQKHLGGPLAVPHRTRAPLAATADGSPCDQGVLVQLGGPPTQGALEAGPPSAGSRHSLFVVLEPPQGPHEAPLSLPRLSAFVAAAAAGGAPAGLPPGDPLQLSAQQGPRPVLREAVSASIDFVSEVFPFLTDCVGSMDPRPVAAALLKETAELLPFLEVLGGPWGPLGASQLLIGLGASCGEPRSEPRPMLPPRLQQHKQQKQQQRLLLLLQAHKDLLEKLLAVALELPQPDSSSSSSSSGSGINEASLVPLLQLYFQQGLTFPAALEVLLTAAAGGKGPPGALSTGVRGAPIISLSPEQQLRLLRLLVTYTQPLEGLQRTAALLRANAETAAAASGAPAAAGLAGAPLLLPFSDLIDIWQRPLGASLLRELPHALPHFKYFSLIDVGEFLWEWGPPEGASSPYQPHPLTLSTGSRLCRGLKLEGGPLREREGSSPRDADKEALYDAVIDLQERVAGETWKLIEGMKFGYTAKALKLFGEMEVHDRRLFRGLLRHLPKIFHFRWGADFVANTFVAAAEAAKTYRLPQRREHKGIQVAPYRLFATLALYLQSPSQSYLGGAPRGGPTSGAPTRGAPRAALGGPPKAPSTRNFGGPSVPRPPAGELAAVRLLEAPTAGVLSDIRGPPGRLKKRPLPLLFEVSSPELVCRVVATACSLRLPLLHLYRLVVLRAKKEPHFFHLEHLISLARQAAAVGFDIDPLLQLLQQRQQQLSLCSPAAVASLFLVLGSGPHKNEALLSSLMGALTSRYALLPSPYYEALDADWARLVASAERQVLLPAAAAAGTQYSIAAPGDSEAAEAAAKTAADAGADSSAAAVVVRGKDDLEAYEEAAAAMERAAAASAAARVCLVASHLQQQQQQQQQRWQGVWVSCGSLPFTPMPDLLLLLLGLVRLRCSSSSLLQSLSSMCSSRQREIEGAHLPALLACLASFPWPSPSPLRQICASMEQLINKLLPQLSDAELPPVLWGYTSLLHCQLLAAEAETAAAAAAAAPAPAAAAEWRPTPALEEVLWRFVASTGMRLCALLSPHVQQPASLGRFHCLVEALPLPSQSAVGLGGLPLQQLLLQQLQQKQQQQQEIFDYNVHAKDREVPPFLYDTLQQKKGPRGAPQAATRLKQIQETLRRHQVSCVLSLPFFPYSLDVALPAEGPPGGPPQGPLGVGSHDWIVRDAGFVGETEAERQAREERQLQLLLSRSNTALPLPQPAQQQQEQQQQQQQHGSKGTALFLIDSASELFVLDLEAERLDNTGDERAAEKGRTGAPGRGPPPLALSTVHGVPVLFLEGPQSSRLLLQLPAYERWRHWILTRFGWRVGYVPLLAAGTAGGGPPHAEAGGPP